MLPNTRSRPERRGIVLVLVLAMLGLLALIGVTFATFAGQSRINNRNYMQSVLQPQPDELIDYALSQLVGDTSDIRSAIRGHSLARDMFGNDAGNNGYVASSPYSGSFHITNITQTTFGNSPAYALTTDIFSADQSMYGYNFTRWIMQVGYNLTTGSGQPPLQTLEILSDSTSNTYRTLTVAPFDSTTTLDNPSFNNHTGTTTPLPGFYLAQFIGKTGPAATEFPFVLDGRWLRAFNGPGMTTNAAYGNFRYNGGLLTGNTTSILPGRPNASGMDEDYDACDLENWFLAIQSADGQVVIPSFHRPSIIRYDPTNGNPAVNDWQNVNLLSANNFAQGWADSASRILRPRNYDGHDASAFPDLVPSTSTGKITYDVDNDGDGLTDSVWLDLGYPARRDRTGKLYKPMFAFMVIGLNGRIPLNTAGNLAGANQTHAAHLGNSMSEVDMTYALQNANQGPNADNDPFNATGIAISKGGSGTVVYGVPPYTYNTQVDNAIDPTAGTLSPVDVRLTQLRNILAGTRPQPFPVPSSLAQTPIKNDSKGIFNGDDNYVYGSFPGAAYPGGTSGQQYYLPNGIADNADVSSGYTDANGLPLIQRQTAPIGGRWGEQASVPGIPFPNPAATPPGSGNPLNLVTNSYHNPIRAGFSFDATDMIINATNSGTPLARDAADDNFNMFDPFPLGHQGELNDNDYYDAVGALLMPVDRMRRWVTPADINGTGSVHTWATNTNQGADAFGRVYFSSYYRPPGAPGVIATNYTVAGGTITQAPGTVYGGVYYPSSPAANPDPYYTGGPNPAGLTAASASNYLPDMTNNPFHGFESYKLPYTTNGTTPTLTSSNNYAGMQVDVAAVSNLPTTYPTYDTNLHNDGLNDADEMNLYSLNPMLDSPFGASDLEWLYRQQDIDGASLSSRLSSLAPISLTNTIDGQRRRRLFSLDSFDLNNFVWTNDNPGGSFGNNSTFNGVSTTTINNPVGGKINSANASFASLSAIRTANPIVNTGLNNAAPTPSLAQRDKKINLNYPLPVSNDPNELVRQKWISDTYQLLKAVLPPRAVDTAEELAQLSQYIINIVDFRDTDATMTHWINPDVVIVPGILANPAAMPAPITGTPPAIFLTTTTLAPGTIIYPFDQYGMEFNPIAINEVLAYTYQYYSGGNKGTNRFDIELVNTLTASAISSLPAGAGTPPDPSVLDIGGFQYTAGDPYSGGTWDLVFTGDDPASRPDPYRGDLVQGGNTYGLIPLNKDSFSTAYTGGPTLSNDVSLVPLSPLTAGPPKPTIAAPTATPPTPATNFYYVIGNTPPAVGGTTYEYGTPSPVNYYPTQIGTGQNQTPTGAAANSASLIQNLATAYDPMTGTTGPTITWRQGVLPGATLNGTTVTPPPTYEPKLPTLTAGSKKTMFFWVCLRRPANPFAPVSLTNPMVVVDSMRFPYMDGTIPPTVAGPVGGPPMVPMALTTAPVIGNTSGNAIYSAQRLQPRRGGHAVPVVTTPAISGSTLDTRYGFTEQMGVPTTYYLSTTPIYYVDVAANPHNTYYASNTAYHTLGIANDNSESWDYLPFNDRDFTSVAELMMVPGCPPGLLTKQFVEFAPGSSTTYIFQAASTPLSVPLTKIPVAPTAPTAGSPSGPVTPASASTPFSTGALASGTALVAHTFPYLMDKFFYTGASLPLTFPGSITLGIDTFKSSVNTASSDGWFKMFEFFEVPSQMIGAIGPVAQGSNFDWQRQDLKAGQLNLNLIVDEEAFFSVVGKQNSSFSTQLLNFLQIPSLPGAISLPLNGGYPMISLGTTPPSSISLPSPVPLVVSAVDANGSPSYVYPISNGSGSGVTATDPILSQTNANLTPMPPNPSAVDSRLKAAFVQFLWLRHGGSGYIFGNGSAGVDQNRIIPFNNPPTPAPTQNYPQGIPTERPFHSLSYPDIDYTVMRPNTLPPSLFTNPLPSATEVLTTAPPTYYAGDPGVRNPNLYGGYTTGGIPTGNSVAATPVVPYPPPIPVRRLFQVPDYVTSTLPYASNAGDSGDPLINNQIPTNTGGLAASSITAPGAIPPFFYTSGAVSTTFSFNNGYPSVVNSGNVTASTPYLGTPVGVAPAPITADNREHPFWRIEMMQRVINQTTVRTHQYAVWITVGFFEVKRQGDINMAYGSATPWLAFDTLGPELGSVNGSSTRYREFLLVDRLKLHGFDPGSPGAFQSAITFRRRIQ
jgi:hypothetical protein